MKETPEGPELIDNPEPLMYLGATDGDGFFIVHRQIDTAEHTDIGKRTMRPNNFGNARIENHYQHSDHWRPTAPISPDA